MTERNTLYHSALSQWANTLRLANIDTQTPPLHVNVFASGNRGRDRTMSENSTSSVGSSSRMGSKGVKPMAGLEKSVRDLQRQTTSLQRIKLILAEEIERSYKRITQAFNDVRTA